MDNVLVPPRSNNFGKAVANMASGHHLHRVATCQQIKGRQYFVVEADKDAGMFYFYLIGVTQGLADREQGTDSEGNQFPENDPGESFLFFHN